MHDVAKSAAISFRWFSTRTIAKHWFALPSFVRHCVARAPRFVTIAARPLLEPHSAIAQCDDATRSRNAIARGGATPRSDRPVGAKLTTKHGWRRHRASSTHR
jgi:hypothetical protein